MILMKIKQQTSSSRWKRSDNQFFLSFKPTQKCSLDVIVHKNIIFIVHFLVLDYDNCYSIKVIPFILMQDRRWRVELGKAA